MYFASFSYLISKNLIIQAIFSDLKKHALMDSFLKSHLHFFNILLLTM